MLKQQQKQIKLFSDVIDKAQYLVTLLNNDLKERIPLKSPVQAVVQLYNVSTQADEKNEVKKSGTEDKRKEENDKRTEGDKDTKLTKLDEKTKPMDKTSESSLKKLSTHLLPSVQIPRELVTQKIPSVNINSDDYITENTKEDNNLILSIKHSSEDDQELHKLIDIVREMRELSDSKSVETSKSVEQHNENRNLDSHRHDTLQEVETNVVTFNNELELEEANKRKVSNSSSLSVNVSSGSNTSIHSIITRNRERLDDESNKQHYLTGDLLKKYQQAMSSKKLAKEFKIDNTLTGKDRKGSKTRWGIENVNTNVDGTTQIILSVDKVNLTGKLSHADTTEGRSMSDSPERSSKKRSSQKHRNTNNDDVNGEHYIMRDMRMQTMSAIALFEDSGVIRNSGGSSVIVNTDDAFRIIRVSDSGEDEAVCSCCTKCFGKRRRRLNNDGYGANISSVQYLRNKETSNNSDGNQVRNRVHSIGESRGSDSKKSDDQQIRQIRVSNSGKVHISDRKMEEENDEDRTNVPKTDSSNLPVPSSHRRSSESKKDSVEDFIKTLTNADNVDVNPIAQSDYTKSDVLEFIRKSTEPKHPPDENKKKLTLMNVNIDQPVIELVDGATGAGGDKNYMELVSNENEEIQSTSRFYPKKVHICTNIDNRTVQDNQHSDGEIFNKSDCSIGEVGTSSNHPESVFIRDLRRSHQKIINRKVHNSNWISYYVAPISSGRTYASRPVNDSSSES